MLSVFPVISVISVASILLCRPMLPHWLWLDHVPEGLALSSEQRLALRKRVRAYRPEDIRRFRLAARIWKRLLPALALVIAAFLIWLFWHMGARLRLAPMLVSNIAGVLLFQVFIWIAIAWSINRAVSPLYWTALNDIGVRVCVQCGYILEHLPRDLVRCPECGIELRPPTEREDGSDAITAQESGAKPQA